MATTDNESWRGQRRSVRGGSRGRNFRCPPSVRQTRILMAIHHWLDANQGAPGATLDLGAALVDRGHTVDDFGYDHVTTRLADKAKALMFPVEVARHLFVTRRAYDVVDGASADLAICLAARGVMPRHAGRATRSHGLAATACAQLLAEACAGRPPVRLRYRIREGSLHLPAAAYAARQADLPLFLNDGDREHGLEDMRVRPDRAHLVANGVLPVLLGHTPERLTDDTVRVAHVGRYTSRKGTRFGSRALAETMEADSRIEVSFVATGVDTSVVDRDFPVGLRQRLRVVPGSRREELVWLLSGDAIKSFPTNSEGVSVALLEAMALGFAPTATATPGPLEVIHDGANGLIVPPRDSGAMTAALLRRASDRTLRDRLRVCACEAAQRYAWPLIAKHTESLYEQARNVAASR
jgi:glycosyltransferase involved in cell wall biosynthesis